MLDLALSPAGRLLLQETVAASAFPLPAALEQALRKASEKAPAELLLQMALCRGEAGLCPVLAFWRRFGERYLTQLCHVPETAENLREPLSPPSEELRELANSAPPMRGGEYLRQNVLERLWAELDEYARQEAAACTGGLSEWLKQRSPLWHRVGRVCFHLAENKRDPANPFAFLATYAPKLLDGRRVQYQPLGKALEEHSGTRNKSALIRLLTPVQRAAERCAWVRQLVDSGEVFHPLAWTPREAHRLLQDIPLLEESGLLVRVPDWWSRRPPRVRVQAAIGERRPGRFGTDAILDFKVELALDGEELSAEERQAVLQGHAGLVFLKGRWVELDRDKLNRALEQWKRVEAQAKQEGISFMEGMRLLAGAPLDPDKEPLFDADGAAWSEVHAGTWLEEQLRAIRQPASTELDSASVGLRGTLRPYQETGVAWLRFLAKLGLGACLADDMGLGKTIQVLALLLLMKREDTSERQPAPALLVLPASLLGNWKSELERFAPTLRVKFAHPAFLKAEALASAAANPASFVQETDLVLTTYAMLSRQEWLTATEWRLAVIDEAQAIKNAGARQTRAVKKLKARAKIALTGTPVENRLADLWSIFDFLNPGLLGSAKIFGDFLKGLEQRASDQYAPLRRLVSPYILRRMKTDKSIIADLPDKTEMQAFCNLTKKQAALYEQSVTELAETLKTKAGIERRGVILAFILRLKQICNHPAHWLATGAYAPEESGKFLRLSELCEEIASRQEKALVFTQFREMTAPLSGFLETVFGRRGLVLHGAVAAGKRKSIVDDFQRDDGPPFFVLSLKAGGVGLNLTAASHVIHFDRWWNPAVENQATDRAFRIGQRKNVMVHKFVCQGTIEEKIDALIRDKTALAGEILQEGVPRLITEMNDKELLELVRLDVNRVAED